MWRAFLVRSLAALLALAATTGPATATTFSDVLVQPPRLGPPERGSVAGAFAHLAFEPGSLDRGDLSLAIPIALPSERGAPLVNILPSYSPGNGQSEWGMGWKAETSLRRFAIVGDIDPAGDEFVGPWGRLAHGDDGRYLPLGASPQISLRRVGDGWVGTNSEGTVFTFGAADRVAGGYAWLLSRVDGVRGESTVFSYDRNASGRPFVSAVEWGGHGSVRPYRLELGYDNLAVAIDDYRSGSKLSLDRRIRDVTIKVRSAAGTFDTRWSYHLDYTASPAGAAFYLTGVTRTFGSGAAEPTQRFEYDVGSATIATATLADVPALDPVLSTVGGGALQPDKAGAFDVEEDGLVDFEIARDQSLVHQSAGGFTVEALPTNPAAVGLCRPPVLSSNLPRVLARMTPGAAPQVFKAVNNAGAGTTRVLVCDRQGVPQSDQSIPGLWALGPTVHLVDLNHDHRPDLVRIFSRGYQVVENTSDAAGHHFVVHPAGTLTDAFTPDSSWVQDMNGDGQADLIMRFSSSISVWYGLGQLQFAPTARPMLLKTISGTNVTDLTTRQLTFLDVNRDGLMDVITTKGRAMSLFVNDGRQLNEVVVPGLSAVNWDFGAPVVADVTGSGEYEVLFVQGAHARQIKLSAPATGLLVAAHDGKGTDVHLGYKRSAPSAGFAQRMTLLDTLTVESSGYDAVTYRYDYGAPVVHSLGKHLVGFASVDKRSPLVTDHVEFVNDDDVSGIPALSETTDDRSPGIVKFALDQYADITFDGVRWLRPSLHEAGHRSSDNTTRLSTLTQYTLYERGFCPTVVTATTPSGQLTTTTTLASVAAIPDEAHCLTASQMLFGAHADATRDFTYLADIQRDDVGDVTRVTQIDPLGASLVLQNASYTADHRVATIAAPGRGTTTMSYDSLGRLTTITDPSGVASQVSAMDPLSDAPLQIQTLRPAANATTFFAYDAKERLDSSWDDISGASQAQPLASYSYQDVTSSAPGRIDTRTLIDASTGAMRSSASLVAADGEPMIDGTWLGDHFALGKTSIADRNTLTQRSAFAGTMTDTGFAAMTSADLRALGTTLVETAHAGFGHAVETTTTQQVGVVGTVTSELVLTGSELITRVHQPGGFTGESAVDAAGKLVRHTDERGVVTHYSYDAMGRLVHLDTPDGGHDLRFDGMARPARVSRDGVGAITYGYDPGTGLLTRKQRLDTTGAVVDTSDTVHDAIGRPIQVTASSAQDSSHLSFEYDGAVDGAAVSGQLGRLTNVRGDGWERSELFDALGREYYAHTVLGGWRSVTSEKTYRTDGSVLSDTLTITDAGGAVKLSSTKETEVDSLGRVSALKVDGAVLYTLSYDDENRLARADFATGEAITFDFDAVTHQPRGHLLQAPAASGGVHWDKDPRGTIGSETFSRDATQTRRDYTYDGRGQLTRATTGSDVVSYSYTDSGLPATASDAAGARSMRRVASRLAASDTPYSWDAAGRATGKGEWSFAYGASGQIVRATRPGRQIDFVYDNANQRVLKRVDGVPVRAEIAGGVLTETEFVELVSVGGVVVGVLDNGQFTAMLADGRGTPFTGPDGALGLASPYGVRGAHLGMASVIDYTRLGWDPDLDLVRMGVRDYDPRLGQFLTADPLYLEDLEKCQSSPLQCSLYGYAGGNPINFVDPTGLGWRDWVAGVCGAVVGSLDAVTFGHYSKWAFSEEQMEEWNQMGYFHAGNVGGQVVTSGVLMVTGVGEINAALKAGQAGMRIMQMSNGARVVVATGNTAAAAVGAAKATLGVTGLAMAMSSLEKGSPATVKGEELDPTKRPVYRGGKDMTMKGKEVKLNAEGKVQPSHGPSLDVDPANVAHFEGGAQRIKSIPDQLKIIQRGQRLEHFEIVPREPMEPEVFQQLLNKVEFQ